MTTPSDITWGQTHHSQEGWSRPFTLEGLISWKFSRKPGLGGSGECLLGEGAQAKALRAGLAARSTRRLSYFSPTTQLSWEQSSERVNSLVGEGRKPRSAEPLRGQTQARLFHRQRAACQTQLPVAVHPLITRWELKGMSGPGTAASSKAGCLKELPASASRGRGGVASWQSQTRAWVHSGPVTAQHVSSPPSPACSHLPTPRNSSLHGQLSVPQTWNVRPGLSQLWLP